MWRAENFSVAAEGEQERAQLHAVMDSRFHDDLAVAARSVAYDLIRGERALDEVRRGECLDAQDEVDRLGREAVADVRVTQVRVEVEHRHGRGLGLDSLLTEHQITQPNELRAAGDRLEQHRLESPERS